MSQANDDSSHWLHSAVEIVYMLKALQKARVSLTGELEQARPFVTMVLEVDEDKRQIILDVPLAMGDQDAFGKRALRLRGALEGIRVEFEAHTPKLVRYEGAPAVAVPIPASLLKVQRRGYFRVATPIDKRITCALSLAGGEVVVFPVVDIGLGGVGLSAQETDPKLNPGDRHQRSKLALPDVVPLEVTVHVCHCATVRRHDGVPVYRYGCKFEDLKSTHETLIQRYVLQLERARRALTS